MRNAIISVLDRVKIVLCIFLLGASATAWASVGGSISGTVKDSTGSLIPHASITVLETETGLTYRAQTDASGSYTLPVLPVGHYQLQIEASGFAGYKRKGIVLDTNAALKFDAVLSVGTVDQTVNVSENALKWVN
jgi:hypothetical protein